jgi:uncharacterized protein (DUF1778 family)
LIFLVLALTNDIFSDILFAMSEDRTSVLVRMSPDQLKAITRSSKAHKLSRNEYMLRMALGELTNVTDALSRLDALEERFVLLEQRVYQFS